MKFTIPTGSSATKWILVGEFLLVAYLLFALTRYVYKNYQVDYHIQNFRELNAQMEQDNRRAAEDLLYYTSPAYAEKMAKRNLGLVNSGEEIIIIPDDMMQQAGSNDDMTSSGSSNRISLYYNLSNPHRWWKFFFEVDHTAQRP